MKQARLLRCLERVQDALRSKGNLSQTSAGGIINRVGNGRGNRHNRRLAATERLHFLAIGQHDIDLGNLLEADDWITIPVQIFLSRGIELDLLEQRSAYALQDV